MAGYYGFTLDVRVSVRLSVRPAVVRPSVRISFPDDNLRKHQWIFTKFDLCIDIVEICLGFHQILTVICPKHAHNIIFGW